MTFLLNKKIIVSSIFFGFLAFLVFIPLETANAWVFDLGMKQLDALDFVDTHVLPLLYRLLKYLVLSQAFLIISAGLLEWTIDLPIILQGNPLVTGGWSFILGLTNLFFLLFFIYIALCHILKIEIGKAFSTTKALTRLIIIALLVNFSLVFIGMFIDVAEVALAAIRYTLVGDGSLIWDAIQPFKDNILILAGGFTGTLTAYLAATLFPYTSVASAAFLFGLAITEAFTGGFTMAILLTAFGAMMGAIFLIYAIFFLVRVVIIWLLAITAPLALASWIFPKTEKHFQTWFKTLIEWLFLGIAGMFFMGLGLNFFANLPAVLEMGDPIKFGRVDIFPAFGFNYLFLILYLAVSLYFVKKYLVPKAMVQAIEQAEGMVKRAGGYGALADRTWSKTAGRAWGAIEGPEKMRKIGERLQMRGIDIIKKAPEGKKGMGTRMKARAGFRIGATLRRTEKEAPKQYEEAFKKLENASDEELFTHLSKRPITLEQKYETAASLGHLIKKGKASSEAIRKIYPKARLFGLKKEEVLKAHPHLAFDTLTTEERIKKIREKGNREIAISTAIRETVEKPSPKDFVKNVQPEALKNLETFYAMNDRKIEAMQKTGSHIQKKTLRETILKNPWDVHDKITQLSKGTQEEKRRAKELDAFSNELMWEAYKYS